MQLLDSNEAYAFTQQKMIMNLLGVIFKSTSVRVYQVIYKKALSNVTSV